MSGGSHEPDGKEADCEWLAGKKRSAILPGPLLAWFQAMRSDHRYQLAIESRDAMTHRFIQMYVDIVAGPTGWIRHMTQVGGKKHYTDELVSNSITFATQQFASFSDAVKNAVKQS